MKNVKEYYDNSATMWSEKYIDEKPDKEVLIKFIKCFIDGGTVAPKILDLGCGNGFNSKMLIEFGAKVVGIDISEKQIEIAKKNITGAKFFVGDMIDSFEKLGKFDGVLCLASIMHINIEDMKTVFENIANSLYEGGLLLLSAFDGVGKNIEKSLVKFSGENYDQNFNNYNAETIASFAFPRLKLVDTWKFDDFNEGWRYYIFQKQEDKIENK